MIKNDQILDLVKTIIKKGSKVKGNCILT